MRKLRVGERIALREALQDELMTIRTLNSTLRQANVHDGQRSDLQKARGVAIREVQHLLEMLHDGRSYGSGRHNRKVNQAVLGQRRN